MFERYEIPDGYKICYSYENCKHPSGPVLFRCNGNFNLVDANKYSNFCKFCDGTKHINTTSSKNGYVYFIFCEDLNRVKIGFTDKPKERIRTLQTSSPCELKLLLIVKSDISLERNLHKCFEHHHVINEWFEYSDEIKRYIDNRKN